MAERLSAKYEVSMSTDKQSIKLKTPCVGACSTVFGDLICRGCKRFAFEVVRWNQFSVQEQQAVRQRLRHLRKLVLERLIQITDKKKLRQVVIDRGVRHDPDSSDFELVHELLRRTASTIGNTAESGFEAFDADFAGAPEKLLRRIEHDFYVLSEAHYRRYFATLDGAKV